MIKFTITSTQGGVGKTTLAANLGALLADLGLRVLLIDADVQPSLSKDFPLATLPPAAGLTEVIVPGEFKDRTTEMLNRLEPGGALGVTLGPVKAVIYRQDSTADARSIASGIREDFVRLGGRVSVLDTVVPRAKAYKEAAALRLPVHRHERRRDGVMPSASAVMHRLAWEPVPSLQRLHAVEPHKPGSST